MSYSDQSTFPKGVVNIDATNSATTEVWPATQGKMKIASIECVARAALAGQINLVFQPKGGGATLAEAALSQHHPTQVLIGREIPAGGLEVVSSGAAVVTGVTITYFDA